MPFPWKYGSDGKLEWVDNEALARALFIAGNPFIQSFRTKEEIKEAELIAKEWERINGR